MKQLRNAFLFFLLAALTVNIPAAHALRYLDKDESLEKGLHIVLVPETNVFEQRRRYRYITDYLSKHLGIRVHVDIMSSYGKICDAFLEGSADAGFFGSFSYVLARAKAGVEPIARPVLHDGSSSYRGYLFVRKDSGIQSVEDMKGRSLVLVDKATTAGYIFPLFYFKNQGIEKMENYFSNILHAGSHDASAWAVYTGEADIGAAKNHVFNDLAAEYPDFKEQMLVLAESPKVPSNCLAVRSNLNYALKLRLRTLLLNLQETAEGREALDKFGAIKFIPTKDEDYSALHNMIKELNIDLQQFPYNN